MIIHYVWSRHKSQACNHESVFTMTVEAIAAQKRPYTPPILIDYGTMAALTRNGMGSVPENKTSYSKNKRA